jgi:hypothetical protein
LAWVYFRGAAQEYGMGVVWLYTALIGATIAFLLSIGIFFLVKVIIKFSDFYVIKQPLNVFRWYYLIPV